MRRLFIAGAFFFISFQAHADFSYRTPGKLQPTSSGQGMTNRQIFAPGIQFPVRLKADQDAFLNSQVWGHGGGEGPSGSRQSDKENFSMPWADNYCEKRSWDMPLCPAGNGHQGQDIRGPSDANKKWEVVAVEDGQIIHVSNHTIIILKGAGGTVYRYQHIHPESILVAPGDVVKKGETLAKISNWLGGKPNTTVHLHFEIKQNVKIGDKVLNVFVPPFTSLIEAYRTSKGLESANERGMLKGDPRREIQ